MRFEEEVALAQQRFIDRYAAAVAVLRRVPGVLSVGVGARERRGELVPELAFRVYVAEKIDAAVLPASSRVPKIVCGLPTDVIVKPDIDAMQSSSSSMAAYVSNWDDAKYRALKGGSQLRTEKFEGDNKRGMGTLGCLARMTDGSIVALTAQHIACAGSDGGVGGACVGLKVGQPRHVTCCCCCTFNEIGAVLRMQKTAQLDCATIKLDDDTKAEVLVQSTLNEVVDIGTLTGVAQAVCFSEVRKRGAATRLTRGTVVDVLYEGSQILINPLPGFPKFAYYGDSGSVIVDNAGKVVGLLWGADRGTTSRGVANHIGPVLAAMGITIAGDAGTTLGIPTANCGSSAPGPMASSSSTSSSSSVGSGVSSSSSRSSSSSTSSSSSRSSSSSSSRSSSSSSSSSGCAHAVLGPGNVPGLSEYRYRIDAPAGSVFAGINWTVVGPTASIVGPRNQRNVIVRFSNAQPDWVSIRAEFTINGNPACAQRRVAVVQVTVDPPVFTNPGRPVGSSPGGTYVFLVNPPALPAVPTWVTRHDPGSDAAAFTYNGTNQAGETRRVVTSNNPVAVGAAFSASTRVTLTSPPQRPTAHRSIQIGYIQNGVSAGTANYPPGLTRTVTVPTADTVDWRGPGATDEWPWYDQGSRATGAGASPWISTLAMTDSPSVFYPAQHDPNHPANPGALNALATAATSLSFVIRMAVRTLDTELGADRKYFDESNSTWAVNFAWPVVPGVSIVAMGAAWTVPATPFEVSINVVPTSINIAIPFLRFIP